MLNRWLAVRCQTVQQSRPRPLRIFPETPTDGDQLGEALDTILSANPVLRRLHRQIVRHQRQLRSAVRDNQRQAYMRVEEVLNYSHAIALGAVDA